MLVICDAFAGPDNLSEISSILGRGSALTGEQMSFRVSVNNNEVWKLLKYGSPGIESHDFAMLL